MNWEPLGVVAEIVGAAGVIITLAYLAMQIRQNTNQLKGEAISTINDTELGLTKELRGDHDLFVLLIRGTFVWGALEPQEQARVHLYLYSYTRWLETCWTLAQGGALTKSIFESRELFLTGLTYWMFRSMIRKTGRQNLSPSKVFKPVLDFALFATAHSVSR